MTVQTSDKQRLTHSRLACVRRCPRQHYLRYECGLRPATDGLALRVGSAFHLGMERIERSEPYEDEIAIALDDPYALAMVAAMIDGHTRAWDGQTYEPVAAEMVFDLPLVNPTTGAPSTVWMLAGKIDRIVRLADGRLALMEYKTTSRDFAPGADYWVQLRLDQQLSIYVSAARALGYEVETVLYDVTRRPSLRPLKATPDDQRKYTKQGTLYANQRDTDETPEEYAGRIAADIASRPEHYFARIEIARLQQDLDDCAAELWAQQLMIRQMQRSGGASWFRNPAACIENYSCPYIDICQSRNLDTWTPEGFTRITDVHPELTQIQSET